MEAKPSSFRAIVQLGGITKDLLLVGFAGAFRRSELVALTVPDLRFSEEVKVTLCFEKDRVDTTISLFEELQRRSEAAQGPSGKPCGSRRGARR